MKKIINNICTISHNVFVGAVELNFTNHGRLIDYHESFRIALDMCAMHQLSNWIIEKNDFYDLSTNEFLLVVHKWIKFNISAEADIDNKIALVTKPQAARKISNLIDNRWFSDKFYLPKKVSFEVFSEQRQAYRFALSAKHLQYT
ncbi:MAG: hypothetical protein ACOCXH_04895 [Cyclobacteriaceae bacterium]